MLHLRPHPFSRSSSLPPSGKQSPCLWHTFSHLWPHGISLPHTLPHECFDWLQYTFGMISPPQLQTFVTTSRQGGQLPTWHLRLHWCPQASTFLQSPTHVSRVGELQRIGGSIFVSPQEHIRGWFETHLQGLQRPRWQNCPHWCFPQDSVLLHVLRHRCLPRGSCIPFLAGQHISLHLCFLHDYSYPQIFLHL